jgi:hypothetical protein
MSIPDRFGWAGAEFRLPMQDRDAKWINVGVGCRVRAPTAALFGAGVRNTHPMQSAPGARATVRVRPDRGRPSALTRVDRGDKNGDVVVRIVGQWSVRLTNLDDGVSREYGTGGQLKLVFHEDGSADVYSSGAVVAAYFVTDFFGPSAWFFRGRLHDSLDASFVLTGHASVGTAEDVCAALMPPD